MSSTEIWKKTLRKTAASILNIYFTAFSHVEILS